MTYELVFVSGTSRVDRPYYDPSTRYRAFNLAEYFRRKGRRVCLISQTNFEINCESFTSARLVLFHRPDGSEQLMRYVLRNIKKQVMIADYDDLVFDVAAVRDTPAVNDRGESVRNTSRDIAAKAEIGSMFKFHTASTVPLSEAMRRALGADPIVIHNALDPIYQDIAKRIIESNSKYRPEYSIGYFSGTASHNKDFEMITPHIKNYLEDNPSSNILLMGPLDIPSSLKPYTRQICQKKITEFYSMPFQIARCNTIIAPLVGNRFSACKSAIKFFEAASLGATVAATPIPDIDRFNNPLLIKCKSSNDWEAALRREIAPNPLKHESAMNLLKEVRIEAQIEVWSRFFLGGAAQQ